MGWQVTSYAVLIVLTERRRHGFAEERLLQPADAHRQPRSAATHAGCRRARRTQQQPGTSWSFRSDGIQQGSQSGALTGTTVSQLLLNVECRAVVATAAKVKIHVSTVDSYDVRKHCSTQIAKRSEDGAFGASMDCSVDCRLQNHGRMEVRVYREDDSREHCTRSCLAFTSFSIRDLLRSKEPHSSLKLRTMDGGNEVGEVRVSRLQVEEETEEHALENRSSVLCDALHGSVQDKEHSPMMRAALCSQVCKVYRFQTEDHRWLLVREQMSETPLSFSLPKQLLSSLIKEHTDRVLEVKELSDLSPHWDGLRHDIIAHCNQLISCYQQTQTELDKLSTSSCFKASSSKSDRHLQFIPTNLHSQRMEVTGPDSSGVWYEVITFGAPADHHQAFKHGGLKRLISKHTGHKHSSVSYSREQSCRARELLVSIAQLQPLIFGLAEELLSVSVEVHLGRLQEVLESLKEQTTMFIHALQDELVRSALLDINNRSASKDGGSHVHTNGLVCEVSHSDQEGGLSPRLQDGEEYSQEEWDRTWANVGKCLDCIIAMVERLQGRERLLREQSSPESQETAGDTKSQNAASPSSFSSSSVGSWQEQLLPLVVTLRDCVREAVSKARAAMTFVVLQGAVAATVAQGPTLIVQRRHAVFSQGLSAVVCGFMLKLFGGLEDPEFLQQLHSVGILVQFEGLLSTYGEEVGMLEDMEVGVADLGGMAFTITEAKSEQIDDLLPTLSGSWGSFVVEVPLPSETFRSLPQELQAGCLIRVEPVLFNIGINQHQSLAERFGDSSLQERVNQQSCERLKAYCNRLREKLPHMAGIQSLLDLLTSLDRSMEAKKRKNVEVLWITASLCRKVNGVRLTSCKSAKDRTAMSVTLEQCMILKEQHALSQQNFSSALDSMRRDGCRTENVQKNIGSRKYAFSSVQLLTFPKLYRPPDGSYG
ncbi:type II inositol 3,4-bisphosphate 4-phosphatase-like isoform X1 [Cyprinodon tularosa]|uniref:type II inositol 3,4-bisphosphate 4-phosphatase-like isoform X1 n=1 Tax=Cyprinodon tularosa TaxID=77115 RepID=UPI0018E231EE|nr:type II inositol 3,4-bisphosphate 4-phosphatase-like isoform X1 [Cyprinodon tularosa]